MLCLQFFEACRYFVISQNEEVTEEEVVDIKVLLVCNLVSHYTRVITCFPSLSIAFFSIVGKSL